MFSCQKTRCVFVRRHIRTFLFHFFVRLVRIHTAENFSLTLEKPPEYPPYFTPPSASRIPDPRIPEGSYIWCATQNKKELHTTYSGPGPRDPLRRGPYKGVGAFPNNPKIFLTVTAHIIHNCFMSRIALENLFPHQIIQYFFSTDEEPPVNLNQHLFLSLQLCFCTRKVKYFSLFNLGCVSPWHRWARFVQLSDGSISLVATPTRRTRSTTTL